MAKIWYSYFLKVITHQPSPMLKWKKNTLYMNQWHQILYYIHRSKDSKLNLISFWIGYLSKDVKVINDLIDDLSKLQVSGNDNDKTDIMTNPLEIDDKESTQSISSSTSRHSDGAQKSVAETAKLKDQVGDNGYGTLIIWHTKPLIYRFWPSALMKWWDLSISYKLLQGMSFWN